MMTEQSTAAHQQLYEDRYKGNYMDTDNYSEWAKKGSTALKVRDTLLRVPIKPEAILDFGCGVGGWTGLLSGMFCEATVSGVDISTSAIEKAQARYPEVKFSVFDGTITTHNDGAFDLIFSFHVLEHVENIDESIAEISRLLKKGGYACIIFPCGNKNSLQDLLMRRMKGGVLPTGDGRFVHFFEVPDGHLRRMTSAETISIFENNGLTLVEEFYAAQVFGWIDWLCRGTGPTYIRDLFRLEPKNFRSRLFVWTMKHLMQGLNWLIRKKDLDLSVKRNPVKQVLAVAAKYIAAAMDNLVRGLSELEWKLFRKKKNGSAQYLVFEKLC
jgi:ubiquinone/menaquinone biosynthesis C-methylase UbiE